MLKIFYETDKVKDDTSHSKNFLKIKKKKNVYLPGLTSLSAYLPLKTTCLWWYYSKHFKGQQKHSQLNIIYPPLSAGFQY